MRRTELLTLLTVYRITKLWQDAAAAGPGFLDSKEATLSHVSAEWSCIPLNATMLGVGALLSRPLMPTASMRLSVWRLEIPETEYLPKARAGDAAVLH